MDFRLEEKKRQEDLLYRERAREATSTGTKVYFVFKNTWAILTDRFRC